MASVGFKIDKYTCTKFVLFFLLRNLLLLRIWDCMEKNIGGVFFMEICNGYSVPKNGFSIIFLFINIE